MYIGWDYKEIEVGDKFVVNRPGFRTVTWTRPLAVTKVTKTQFTLEPIVPENEQTEDTPKIDAVPQRYSRGNGRRIGDAERHFRGWRAERATEKRLADIEEIVKEQERAMNEQAAKERAEEQALREKHGTTGITDEAVQKKYVKPLVELIEQGEAKVAFAMKEFEGKELTVDNFNWFARRTARYMEGGEIETGLVQAELAAQALGQLVKLLESFRNGTRLSVNDKELTTEAEVAQAFLMYVTRREVDRFFWHSLDAGKVTPETAARHKFVAKLRTIVADHRATDHQVKVIKDEAEEAA